jgi:hypothetical protein
MLKLPRTTLEPEQLAAVENFFTSDVRPVCMGSEIVASHISLEQNLRDSLRSHARTGCITRGLETIAKFLDDEKKGLVQMQEKTGQPDAQRMSRLLLFSSDGSERFYRQVASLLKAHGNRVWGCRLDVSDEELGALVVGEGNPAKALLINDKKALASFLTELSRNLRAPEARQR